jgi:hypothetical protein
MRSGWIGSGGAKARFVQKESLPPLGGRTSTSTITTVSTSHRVPHAAQFPHAVRYQVERQDGFRRVLLVSVSFLWFLFFWHERRGLISWSTPEGGTILCIYATIAKRLNAVSVMKQNKRTHSIIWTGTRYRLAKIIKLK